MLFGAPFDLNGMQFREITKGASTLEIVRFFLANAETLFDAFKVFPIAVYAITAMKEDPVL